MNVTPKRVHIKVQLLELFEFLMEMPSLALKKRKERKKESFFICFKKI